MAQQVAGSNKTLIECIRDGEVERPALMRWNAWQAWRSGAGRRPVVSREGHTTTAAEESALWKSVMCDLYGTEWSIQIASEETEAAPGAAPSSQPSEPGLVPAAGAGVPLTPGLPVEQSPGSGASPTGAANPGSGPATPVPPWSSQNPGTPTRLNHEVVKEYQPAAETLERYQTRVKKQAQALENLGEPLGEGVLPALLAKAAYELRLYEEAKEDAS